MHLAAKAGFGQHAEGLAQRVARDFQALAQCRFGQALARGELTMHDFLAHLLRNAVGEVLLRVGGTRHGLGGLVLRQQV